MKQNNVKSNSMERRQDLNHKISKREQQNQVSTGGVNFFHKMYWKICDVISFIIAKNYQLNNIIQKL